MALRFLNSGYFAGKVGIGTDNPTSSLTISSSAGGDHTWDESGILIQNLSTTTGESAVVFKNSGTGGTGSNYWFTGLNQSNIYRLAYGPNFENGYTFLQLSSLGALTLDAYDSTNNTGTPTYLLGTDASGNVVKTNTVPGSGAGPYLPLSAGSSYPLTGDLYLGAFNKISGVTGDNLVIGVDISNTSGSSSFDIQMDGATSAFYINNSRNVGIGTDSPIGKLYVGPTWDTSSGGDLLYIKNTGTDNNSYDPQVTNTSDLGITMVRDSATTTGPDTVGLTLYNDDGTAGGFSPMLLFSKLETPTSQFKATMAGIYARSPLGTGNGGSWIDGELIFATAGAASQGIKQRMVINKEGNVGIGTTSPSEKLDVSGNVKITNALLSNQENTNVDTGAEVVAQVSTSTYTAAFFDFVIKKVGNIRSGTVYACHDGTNVEFTETSTNDLGDTSDVTLSVDKSGTNLRLIATVTSDDWIIKSLIRAI